VSFPPVSPEKPAILQVIIIDFLRERSTITSVGFVPARRCFGQMEKKRHENGDYSQKAEG
jgi:hypothetical protein